MIYARPMFMVFARLLLAYLVQALVAVFYTLRSNPHPWLAAAPWWTVTGSLIDLASLGLLVWLTHREGLQLKDLIAFDPPQFWRDLARALMLTVILLVVGLVGGIAASTMIYGSTPPPRIMGPLPLWAALYSVLVWPILWAIAEQMTYNGYAAPRLQAFTGKTWAAVLITCTGYGLQHIALPGVPNLSFMLYRFLPAFFIGLVMVPLYLRWHRLLPFIIAHWFLDTLSTLTQILLPLIR